MFYKSVVAIINYYKLDILRANATGTPKPCYAIYTRYIISNGWRESMLAQVARVRCTLQNEVRAAAIAAATTWLWHLIRSAETHLLGQVCSTL